MVDVGIVEELGFIMSYFFSSRRRHTRFDCDWSSDVCSSDHLRHKAPQAQRRLSPFFPEQTFDAATGKRWLDRKSTRLNSSHSQTSYADFCLKKKKTEHALQIKGPLSVSGMSLACSRAKIFVC